jgi:hypothetical protein
MGSYAGLVGNQGWGKDLDRLALVTRHRGGKARPLRQLAGGGVLR